MATTSPSAALLEALFEPIQALPAFQELLRRLQAGRETWCSGTVRSSRPVLLAALRRRLPGPLLWLTPSADGAERLVQDLASFLPEGTRADQFVGLQPDYLAAFFCSRADLAAAKRAIGTRNGEQDT